MGNVILAGDFSTAIASSDITARSEAANNPTSNLLDYWYLKKDFRSTDAAVGNYLILMDFGAARSLNGVFFNDVNFDRVSLQGATGSTAPDSTTWDSPDYDTEFTVSLDTRVGRRKVYCNTTGFNYRYLRVYLSSDAVISGDLSVWAIGNLALLESGSTKTIKLSENISYGYQYNAEKPIQDNAKKGGSKERIEQGTNRIWHGEIPFGLRSSTDETQLWKVNALDISEPLIFYENEGNTQYAYLCLRENSVSIVREGPDLYQPESIRFTELI